MKEEKELLEKCLKEETDLSCLDAFLEKYPNSTDLIKVKLQYFNVLDKFTKLEPVSYEQSYEELRNFLLNQNYQSDLKCASDSKCHLASYHLLKKVIKLKNDSFKKEQFFKNQEEFWGKVCDKLIEKEKEIHVQYVIDIFAYKGKTIANEYSDLFDLDILTDTDLSIIPITRSEVRKLQEAKVHVIKTNMSDLDENSTYSLPDDNTEIYFWGMPGSGKTCCLGSFLSVSLSNGYCMGYTGGFNGASYFEQLTNVFDRDEKLCSLVQSTNENSIAFAQYKFKHPIYHKRAICLIDLAGETFKSLHMKSRGLDMDDVKRVCLNVTESFLMDKRNRKLHFFLIPYSEKGDEVLSDGYTATNYLQAGINYLAEHKVISSSTDGIYIIVTKVDRMYKNHLISDKQECKHQIQDDTIDEEARRFIYENYKSFYNGLNDICVNNGIGRGTERVKILGFSIGDMFATDMCRFSNHGAERLIDLICMKSVKLQESSKFIRFLDKVLKF